MSRAALRWLLSFVPRVEAAGARLTIVRHHRVYGADERPLYRLGVSESVLEDQLTLLDRLGRTPITVAEGLRHLESGRPGHRVAMTFDDGYADNVTRAFPILRRHGARATFYLTAGWIEERRTPWWDVLAHALEQGRPGRAVPGFGSAAGGATLDGAGRRGARSPSCCPRSGCRSPSGSDVSPSCAPRWGSTPRRLASSRRGTSATPWWRVTWRWERTR